nr:unnamed protein product [Callosobruchus analis]
MRNWCRATITPSYDGGGNTLLKKGIDCLVREEELLAKLVAPKEYPVEFKKEHRISGGQSSLYRE